jgi:hypothetical protein
MILDAHQHFWRYDAPRFDWISGDGLSKTGFPAEGLAAGICGQWCASMHRGQA